MTHTEFYRGYFAFLNIYSKDSSTFQRVGELPEDMFPKLCDGRFVFSPFLCTAPNKLHLRDVMCLSYSEFKSVPKKRTTVQLAFTTYYRFPLTVYLI